jgi:hypothetical protein
LQNEINILALEKAVPHLPGKELYMAVEFVANITTHINEQTLNRKEKVSKSVCDTFWTEELATRLYQHSITNPINVRLLSNLTTSPGDWQMLKD